MHPTWASWDLDDMQDAAEADNWLQMSLLEVPERVDLTSLPYHEDFVGYREHVTRCPDCRRGDRPDCSRGRALLETSHAGLMAQHRISLDN